jgi:hypothetical protein
MIAIKQKFHNSSSLFIKLTSKSFKPFFGHLKPIFQDRKNGEAPGKTVTGFAGRKKVYRICS